MASYFGKATVARDGETYRSQFESDFVNKFLIPSGLEFLYEVRYPDSRMTCDFVIPKYDIWIECVFHNVGMQRRYESLNDGKRIDLITNYNDRNHVKDLGATWDPTNKKWFIIYCGSRLDRFHRFMDPQLVEEIWASDRKAINADYDDHLSKKMELKKNLIVVTHDDLKYNDLNHLICAKENIAVFKNITTVTFGQESKLNSGINISKLYQLAEQKLEDIKKQNENVTNQEDDIELLEKRKQQATKQKKAKKEKKVETDETDFDPMAKVKIFKDLIENNFNGDYTVTKEKVTFITNAMGITVRNAIGRLERVQKSLKRQKKLSKRMERVQKVIISKEKEI
jgi:hypothetical protein